MKPTPTPDGTWIYQGQTLTARTREEAEREIARRLTLTDHRAISRQRGLGIPDVQIAAEFGISVRDVQRIDRREREKSAVRRRVAEPLPAPKPIDWKTARPPEDRVRRGEPCRSPGCEGTVERGSYCGHCADRMYVGRAA